MPTMYENNVPMMEVMDDASVKKSLVGQVDLNQRIANAILNQVRKLSQIIFNMNSDPVNEPQAKPACMAEQIDIANETLDKAARILADINELLEG